ncbi:MAG: hypothetical protein ABIH18_01840 [Candidatus Omnitrophota bacterium]
MVKIKKRIPTIFYVLRLSSIILLLSSFVFLPSSFVYSAVPHLINYQGRLTDTSSVPLNGLYNIIFRLYDAENAGNLLWQGTYTSVSISKGIFNILLGDINDAGFNFAALAFDKPYWLEIKVGTDDPMTPRQRITSVGYAIRAEKADAVTGIEIRTSDPSSPIAGQIWLRTDSVKTNMIKLPETLHTYVGSTYGAEANSIDGDFSTYQADSIDQQLGNGSFTKTSISQHIWFKDVIINSITYKIRTHAFVTGVQNTSYEYHQKIEYTTDGTNWILVPGTLVEGGPFGSNQGDKDITTNTTIATNLTGVMGIRAYCSVSGQQSDGWIYLANQIFEIQAFSDLQGGLRIYDGEKVITIAQ